MQNSEKSFVGLFAIISTSSSGFILNYKPPLVDNTGYYLRLVDKVNTTFNGSFNAQLMASFAMVSISTFETMVAASVDPKMAIKFAFLMVVAFVQLSTWCVAGTLVYSQVGCQKL